MQVRYQLRHSPVLSSLSSIPETCCRLRIG